MSTIDYIALILVLLFIACCIGYGIALVFYFLKYLYDSFKSWRDSPETSYIFSLIVVWLLYALLGWIIYPIKPILNILCPAVSVYIISLQIKRSRKRKKQERERLARIASEPPRLSREEIIATAEFQRSLQKLLETYQWITFADARHSLSEGDYCTPVYFAPKTKPYIIEFKKTWVDLWLENLNQYYNGKTWSERENGINQFAFDLFGDKAEEMKGIINIEYIADHLIEIENPNSYDSDYTIKCEIIVSCPPQWNYCGDIRELYIECLNRTLYPRK